MKQDSKATILIVDDEPVNLGVLFELLREAGYRVLVAEDGAAALQSVDRCQPDIILLDVKLPDMDGFELHRRLQESDGGTGTPVIFLSALSGTAETAGGLAMNAVDYITKPFQVEEVVARIENHLTIHSLRRRLEEQNNQLQQEIAKSTRMKEELRKSRDEYEATLQGIVDGVTMQDTTGGLVYANDAAARLSGYPSGQALLAAPTMEVLEKFEMFDEAGRSLPFEQLPGRLALQGEPNPEIILRYRIKATGEERWTQLKSRPLFDEHGQVRLAINIFHDITERKQVELALREKQAELLEAQRIAGLGHWSHDLVTGKIEWSEESFRIAGIEPQEVTPEIVLPLIHPDDLIILATAMEEAAKGKGEQDHLFRLIWPDGQVRHVHNRWESDYDDAGRELKRIGTHQDITGRVMSEEALRESERNLSEVVEFSPVGIGVFDSEGNTLQLNRKFIELVGYTLEDIPTVFDWSSQAYPDEAYREKTIARWDKDVMKAVETGIETPTREYTVTCKDGAIRDIEITMKPGRDRQLVTFVDVTKRKRAEEALRQAQKMESLGVLAGGVAHDFNNLLVAMLGQTSLALAKMSSESAARPHVEKGVKAAERASDLTQQMLAYSGRGHFEVRPLDLNALITENLHLFEAGMPKNVHLRSELAQRLPPMEADAGQMQQVVMNLIINGAEAIGERPGTVLVATGVQELNGEDGRYWQFADRKLPPGRYVTLEVHDNGGGMDAETLSKVFDPFFTTKQTGRGLGMAAVLGIVNGHKGGIRVYSEPGQGTTFKLLFPAGDVAPAGQEMPEAVAGAEMRPGLVLVIDDEEPVLEAVSDILELEGIEVITASDGLGGLQLFRERMADISLVLLDLSMPRMSGVEVFRKLRQIDPEVRVILSSGYNEVEATRRFSGKGLAGFIQKPYSAIALVQEMKRYLGS